MKSDTFYLHLIDFIFQIWEIRFPFPNIAVPKETIKGLIKCDIIVGFIRIEAFIRSTGQLFIVYFVNMIVVKLRVICNFISVRVLSVVSA